MIVDVPTTSPYRVHIGAGLLAELPALVSGASVVAIVHTATLAHYLDAIAAAIPTVRTVSVQIPDAEAGKSAATLASCWEAFANAGMTRSDVVIGLGGGAATDLAGFVAATWLRGVGYVVIPTTVLGMVDAAVGGKTGINLPQGKNLVGAFWEPRGVLCDLSLLGSLPASEVSSGLAEVVKCGFIADLAILTLASRTREALDVGSDTFAELIGRAVAVKASVVAGDFRETTSTSTHVGRELLNYGHTLAHAIEARERYVWRHGPAVAVGMVWIAEVSRRLLGLPAEIVEQHRTLLGSLGLPTTYVAPWEDLRPAMSLDKKARGSVLRLIGLRDIAEAALLSAPDEDVLAEAYAAISA